MRVVHKTHTSELSSRVAAGVACVHCSVETIAVGDDTVDGAALVAE